MDFITVIFIALALSMDAFAVSMCIGTSAEHDKTNIALRAGVFFGLFQAIMPMIGWIAGYFMKGAIENIDHWIAFGLLFIIGLRMIYEAAKQKSYRRIFNIDNLWVMISLSLATSIDALAVGLSFALLQIPILLAVAIIGVITFGLSFAGVHIGEKLSGIIGNKVEIAGGIVLIGIGVKILIEHLWFH
jgi:putative Mn2+ efflux pump MntP